LVVPILGKNHMFENKGSI